MDRDVALDDMCRYVEDAMANGRVMRGEGLAVPIPDGWLSLCDHDMWGYEWPDRGAEGAIVLGRDFASEWELVCQMDDASEAGKVEYRCDVVRQCKRGLRIIELSVLTGVVCAPTWWDDMFE